MPQFARRASKARPSVIMAIAERAKKLKGEGRDIISFSVGVPNFLPDSHVYEAARQALDADTGQYGATRGSGQLLDAFSRHIDAIGLPSYTRENCVVGAGAKHLLYTLAEVLLDEGDEIVFPAPYYAIYKSIADIVGAKTTALPCTAEQNYKLTPEQLEQALASHPKVFLFNNPSNPTGMVYTRDEVAALADVLVKYPETWIITDDIYNRMVFDGIGYHHFLHTRPELEDRLIFIDSLSKTYGMPGWRVGMLAGPAHVARTIAAFNSNNINNLPEVVVAAAVAALTGPQDVTEAKCAEFSRRRDTVVAALNGIEGISCPQPQGAFYAFPDVSCMYGKSYQGRVITDDVALCEALLDIGGVACVPGSAFGEPRGIRISYTCPAEQLEPGLDRIQTFFSQLRWPAANSPEAPCLSLSSAMD